jgi:tight adherence protein C
MTIAALTFAAVFLFILSGALLLFYRSAVLGRLASVVSPGAFPAEGILQRVLRARPKTSSLEQAMNPFQKMLPRTAQEVSVVQKRLMLAGYRKDAYVNLFYGAKVLAPALLLALVTVTQVYHYGAFFAYALAAGLGFLLPDFWLGNRIRARQLKIRLGLPEALDLMVICIEAGLGLDQAILRVADELALSQPEIAEELNLVNLEQRAGRPRAEALRNLAERTDLDSVRGLVAMLIQTDHFGTSLTHSLRVHSDSVRTQRRQQAEEEAAKTTVKLVFPLVLFIFPSLFVVTLGPAMISIKEAFEKYLLN